MSDKKAAFERLAKAVQDPSSILASLEAKRASDEELEVLVNVYPALALQVYDQAGDAFRDLLRADIDAAFQKLLDERDNADKERGT